MNTENTAAPSVSDDEISVYDLWRMLVDGWYWILGGGVVGASLAAAYLSIATPRYEALALIQIGQIGQVGQIGQIGQVGDFGQTMPARQGGVVPVETPARVIERIMFPTFTSAIVKKLGWGGDVRGAIFEGSLKAMIAKGTDLIELRVRGLTKDDAASSLRATVEHLALLHKDVAQPVIESLQTELSEISAEAKEASKTLSDLQRMVKRQTQVALPDRVGESVLYAQLSATYENRIRELRRKEAQYRQWISFTGKVATGTFAGPSVPDAPVSPRKGQTLIAGALGGVLLGALVSILRSSGQRRRGAR